MKRTVCEMCVSTNFHVKLDLLKVSALFIILRSVFFPNFSHSSYLTFIVYLKTINLKTPTTNIYRLCLACNALILMLNIQITFNRGRSILQSWLETWICCWWFLVCEFRNWNCLASWTVKSNDCPTNVYEIYVNAHIHILRGWNYIWIMLSSRWTWRTLKGTVKHWKITSEETKWMQIMTVTMHC